MRGWRIAVWAAIVVVALTFLYMVRGILLPFVLAFIISVLLDPSIRKLRKRGLSRGFSIGIIVGSFFLVATALLVWLAPMVGQQVGAFRDTVEKVSTDIAAPDPNRNYFVRWNPVVQIESPPTEDTIDGFLKSVSGPLSTVGLPTTRKALYDRYVAPNSKQIATSVQNFFNGFFGLIGNFASSIMMLALTPLLVIFMLLEFDTMKRRMTSFIPPSIRASTVEMLNDVGNIFVSYLRGVTISVLIYMAITATLLTMMGVPYSVLLAVLFGALYLIPFLGEFISYAVLLAVCAFSGNTHVAMFEVSSPLMYGIVCLVMVLVFNRIYDTFVYARIVGKAVGLSAFVGMFVAFSGGALFGIPGMLLAFPTAGAVKVVLDRLIRITSSTAESIALPAVPIRHRA